MLWVDCLYLGIPPLPVWQDSPALYSSSAQPGFSICLFLRSLSQKPFSHVKLPVLWLGPRLNPTSPWHMPRGHTHLCARRKPIFWGAVCTLRCTKWRSGHLQCESASEPKPFPSTSLGKGPCPRPHPFHGISELTLQLLKSVSHRSKKNLVFLFFTK